MAESMMGIGLIIKCMDKELLVGVTEESILVIKNNLL